MAETSRLLFPSLRFCIIASFRGHSLSLCDMGPEQRTTQAQNDNLCCSVYEYHLLFGKAGAPLPARSSHDSSPGFKKPNQLAASHLLKPFRSPRSFDFDIRGGTFDFAEIFERKFDVSSSEILFQAMKLGCSRYWNNPRLLRKQPGECDLSGRCLFVLREFNQQIDQGLTRLSILRVKARNGVAEIRTVEFCCFVDLAREKARAQRAKWNESNPKLFERRQEGLFWLSPPQRVLTLNRSHWLDRMGAPDGLHSCFRKTEMLHFARPNQVFDRSGYVFNGNVGIDPMLIQQVDDIDLESL